MAEVGVLTSCKLWFGAYDFSGQMNALALNYGAEPQDNTVFGDVSRNEAGGLKTLEFQHEGLWAAGAGSVDERFFAEIGTQGTVMSVGLTDGADGNPGFLTTVLSASYSPGAAVGEILRFSISGRGVTQPVSGTVLAGNKVVTANGNGTAYQVGDVIAGKSVYGSLHVTAFDGTSLDVIVQSDDASGFPSSADQLTFTQATGITSERKSKAGVITDDWWRVNYTVVGTSFTFSVVIGII